MRAQLPLALSLLAAAPAAAQLEAASADATAGFASAQGQAWRPFAAHPVPHRAPATPPQPPQVCTPLDFHGVTWPAGFTHDDESALELALSISGSFEGPDAWSNITGNFDGQGVSLGLLNQNLGQGSLQPMLLRLRDEHPEVLKGIFTPEHETSLLDMLAQWQGAVMPSVPVAPKSPLDEHPPGFQIMSAGDSGSVAWARNTLYAGDHFDPVWKAELQKMAAAPEYVTIQIDSALDLHTRALVYEKEIGVKELRSYLMLFDVNVQNGGLYQEDLDDYARYVKANPHAVPSAKLEKLLALRLRHVRKAYISDVRSRKRAIIRGTGNVHGEARNLPVQYCYDGAWPYRQ